MQHSKSRSGRAFRPAVRSYSALPADGCGVSAAIGAATGQQHPGTAFILQHVTFVAAADIKPVK